MNKKNDNIRNKIPNSNPLQTGENCPLLTAIIIHYNNGDYIYETIRSVLEQDYPNIELIISDDCSPNGFNADRVIQYIGEHRKENLKQVIINENKSNLGTVRHLEVVRTLTHGEIELLIAADDVWHDSHVFSAFAQRFEELGEDAEWITSQVEMCDETMTRVTSLFIKPETIRMLEQGDYQALLNLEGHVCQFPSLGTAYRRSFFEKIHNLSSDYYLIEDYTTHLRALRLGIPVHYLDIVSAKHRHGGISHGNHRNGKILFSRYLKDFLTAFEKEVLPHRESFSEDGFQAAEKLYQHNQKRYAECMSELNLGTANEIDLLYVPSMSLRRALLANLKTPLITLSRKEPVLKDMKRLTVLFLLAALCRMGSGTLPQPLLDAAFRLGAAALFLLLAFRVGVNLLLRVWHRFH